MLCFHIKKFVFDFRIFESDKSISSVMGQGSITELIDLSDSHTIFKQLLYFPIKILIIRITFSQDHCSPFCQHAILAGSVNKPISL